MVKTMRFLVLTVFVTGALASCVGATAGAFVLVHHYPSSSLRTKWIDWFVADVSLREDEKWGGGRGRAICAVLSEAPLTAQLSNSGPGNLRM